jgi:hypothetical protein
MVVTTDAAITGRTRHGPGDVAFDEVRTKR